MLSSSYLPALTRITQLIRDEATQLSDVPYRALEFVTDVRTPMVLQFLYPTELTLRKGPPPLESKTHLG